jgi:hypothetical protein
VTTTPLGVWGVPTASPGSTPAHTRTSPAKVTNQGSDCRVTTNNKAPSGAVNAHRHTDDEFSKPPRLTLQDEREGQAHPQPAASK